MEDDALLADVGAAIRKHVGAVPDRVVAAGKQVCTWRTIDAEIAALTFDSLLDEPIGAVRASADGPRVLRFEAGGLTVELKVENPPAGRRLSGQLVPPDPTEVHARAGDDVWRGVADRFGRFVVPLPSRPEYVDLRFIRSAEPLVALLSYL
jgi:hypothetical protein